MTKITYYYQSSQMYSIKFYIKKSIDNSFLATTKLLASKLQK